MPLSYVIDQLAQRWSTNPQALEDLDAETVARGLEFIALEASVKVKKSDGKT